MDTNPNKNNNQKVRDDLIYAQSIVDTIREPLIVLDASLKVVSANQSFYQTFKVDPKETEGQLIFHLGNGQWNIPVLRKLLTNILHKSNVFNDYTIEHKFETIGMKTMLLNARRLDSSQMILLAIEDITGRKKTEELEKMNRLMVARELKMIELKEEIKKLEARLQKISKNKRGME